MKKKKTFLWKHFVIKMIHYGSKRNTERKIIIIGQRSVKKFFILFYFVKHKQFKLDIWEVKKFINRFAFKFSSFP